MTIIATNKHGLHNYQIINTLESGIELLGHEVKSIKNGQINLSGAYISHIIDKKHLPELFLKNCHVSPYKMVGKTDKIDPLRIRKLLLRRKEINTIISKIQQKGLTIIPIKVYTKHSLIKLEIDLAKGKKKFDKRADLKEKEVNKKIRQELKVRRIIRY